LIYFVEPRSTMEIFSFRCSDNADDEIWHSEHANKLLEPYRAWFKQRNFEYKKDFDFKFVYDIDNTDFLTIYRVFMETSNEELLALFKLRWL